MVTRASGRHQDLRKFYVVMSLRGWNTIEIMGTGMKKLNPKMVPGFGYLVAFDTFAEARIWADEYCPPGANIIEVEAT